MMFRCHARTCGAVMLLYWHVITTAARASGLPGTCHAGMLNDGAQALQQAAMPASWHASTGFCCHRVMLSYQHAGAL